MPSSKPPNAAPSGSPSPFELWHAIVEEYARLRDHARNLTVVGIASIAAVVAASNSLHDRRLWLILGMMVVFAIHWFYLHMSVKPRQKHLASLAGELERVFRPTVANFGAGVITHFALFDHAPDPSRAGPPVRYQPDPGGGLWLLSVAFLAASLVALFALL